MKTPKDESNCIKFSELGVSVPMNWNVLLVHHSVFYICNTDTRTKNLSCQTALEIILLPIIDN